MPLLRLMLTLKVLLGVSTRPDGVEVFDIMGMTVGKRIEADDVIMITSSVS